MMKHKHSNEKNTLDLVLRICKKFPLNLLRIRIIEALVNQLMRTKKLFKEWKVG